MQEIAALDRLVRVENRLHGILFAVDDLNCRWRRLRKSRLFLPQYCSVKIGKEGLFRAWCGHGAVETVRRRCFQQV